MNMAACSTPMKWIDISGRETDTSGVEYSMPTNRHFVPNSSPTGRGDGQWQSSRTVYTRKKGTDIGVEDQDTVQLRTLSRQELRPVQPRLQSDMSWGYKSDNGPHTWAVQFPHAAGHGQSPINVETGDLVFDYYIAAVPLKISYVEEEDFVACNTGESFKVNIEKTSELQGGPLKDTFRLEQFHLHWGSKDGHGSEHTIDGQTYAAELHLVHWNCTKYGSFGEAVDKPDGLAVLGVLIKPGSEHKGFRDLVDTMKSVTHKGNTCKVLKAFDPACLLPEETKSFYTYHGSLTTPPCYESVQWILFSTPVELSSNQLEALRELKNTEGGDSCIVDNYRPPMPLGSRKVRVSFEVGTEVRM